uniref:Uncharacterized protein n=1 Tax=Anguilla anguilla TaxID=7936 RepID=A0A0E9SBI2_ANGAN
MHNSCQTNNSLGQTSAYVHGLTNCITLHCLKTQSTVRVTDMWDHERELAKWSE